jgi:hypothetical protein
MAGIRSKSTPVCGPGQVTFGIGERYGCSKCSGDGQGTNFRTGQQEGDVEGAGRQRMPFLHAGSAVVALEKNLALSRGLFIMIIKRNSLR